MSSAEVLVQPSDFPDPTVLDIFAFERLFDSNLIPYLAFSPDDYLRDGPQLELDYFPVHDVTGRREDGGVVNMTERENAMELYGKAMKLLQGIRGAYVFSEAIGEPLQYTQVLRLAHMGIELPRYIAWRYPDTYPNGTLPPEAVILSRALRGFHGTTTRLIHSHSTPGQAYNQTFLNTPYSAETLKEWILEKKQLSSSLVCAASWGMITNMLELMESGGKKVVESATPYNPRELMDFAKSMRYIWDVVFPGVERALKRNRTLQVIPLDGFEWALLQDRLMHDKEFPTLLKSANMANYLVRLTLGYESKGDMTVHHLVSQFAHYGQQSELRAKKMDQAVAEFRNNG